MIDILDQRNHQRISRLARELKGETINITKKENQKRKSIVSLINENLEDSFEEFDKRVEELRKINLNNKIDLEFFNQTYNGLMNKNQDIDTLKI